MSAKRKGTIVKVNLDPIMRWLPTFGRVCGHAAVATVGLGLMTGLAAGPASAGMRKPESVTQAVAQAVEQAKTTANPSAEAGQAQAPAATKAPATKAPAKKAPAKAAPQAPSTAQLMPNGVPGDQVAFVPTAGQMANAKSIIDTGKAMKLSPRAWVIAVATSLQESHLNNYGHLGAANDHDSLGLFQQRPSSGWGAPAQLTDPRYAATAFYRALANVPGYDKMPLTNAAQTVQVSAFPYAYAKWEKMAADLVQATYGHGPYAAQAKR
jgi:hypothetical protein